METFVIIPNYPAYRISNYGRIQSRWQRKMVFNGININDVWKDIIPNKEKKGYLSVNLCNGIDKPKRYRIHNLVALCFLGDKKDNNVVRHLDSNPENNNLENLKYGSYSENENDKRNNNTYFSRNTKAKITKEIANEIRVLHKNNVKIKELVIKFDLSKPTISRIINNLIWKD